MQCSIKDGEKGVSHTDIWLLIKSAKFYVILFRFKRNENILLLYTGYRGEICRDRHDWRSCKICASCVNFPGIQRNFLHNLRRTRFKHTKCDFALKL